MSPRYAEHGEDGFSDLWLRTANAELTIGYLLHAANAAPLVGVVLNAAI